MAGSTVADASSFVWAPHSLADVSGILGLIVSIVGFIYTIFSVYEARRAALKAEAAAVRAVNSVRLFDAVADFSAAASIMEDIKRHHRHGAWDIILDRYTALKRLLIEVKELNRDLTSFQKTEIQSVIQKITEMESKVDHLLRKGKVPDAATLNDSISFDLNRIHEILVSLKLKARS